MTSQTKKFIELSDILGLRFECTKCGTTLLIPLSREIFIKKLYVCPHCEKQWIRRVEGGTIETLLSDCLEKLRLLSNAITGDRYDGFSLTLEVKVEEESPKPSAFEKSEREK